MDTLGEEATKHLLKAYIAFDRDFRKLYKSFYQKSEEDASKDLGKRKKGKKS